MVQPLDEERILLRAPCAAWLLRKRRAVAPLVSLLIPIHIGIPPGGSLVHTPPFSPLERVSRVAVRFCEDIANEVVNKVGSVPYMSEDLAVSESTASEFEVLQSHSQRSHTAGDPFIFPGLHIAT